ncbi:MAG: hypothetical protein K2O65_05965 [Lachnospiraceae bacterium]|nr:hypothetical protein [Lachnospiraceae bacterium]
MQDMKDPFQLSTEIEGVAMVIAGLGNQLDSNKADILNPSAMKSALYGVQIHLERIAEDLEKAEKGGAV